MYEKSKVTQLCHNAAHSTVSLVFDIVLNGIVQVCEFEGNCESATVLGGFMNESHESFETLHAASCRESELDQLTPLCGDNRSSHGNIFHAEEHRRGGVQCR
jgi:hypothetical protein